MKMKRFLLAFLVLSLSVCLLAFSAEAATTVASGTCGDTATWTLDSDGLLTVSGTGRMTNMYNDSDCPWVGNRQDIKTVVIDSGITLVGCNAFENCVNLTSVTVKGSSVIGIDAFQGCIRLTSVSAKLAPEVLENGFKGCTRLTSVDMPMLQSIGKGAFQDCTALTAYNFPDTLEAIGMYGFSGCTRLETVSLPASVQTVGPYAFDGCSNLTSLTIAGDATIDGWAFQNCVQLAQVQIPNVVELGSQSFYHCTALTSIVGDKVLSVGSLAFSGCTRLETASFKSASSFALSAFSDCTALTSIAMDNVSTIGISAFKNCTSLTSVVIPATVAANGISTDAFYGCTALQDVTILAAARVDERAFYGCTNLKSLVMPDVTAVGDNAFAGCAKLTVVDMPCVTEIGEKAFQNCTGLVAIGISGELSLVEKYAFDGCTNLKEVYNRGTAEDWATVSISTSYNEPLLNAKLIHNAALPVLEITTQPTIQIVKTLTFAPFTVKATGIGLSYQWQYRTSASGAWINAAASGNKTADLKVDATVSKDGFQYRCVITDTFGQTIYTDSCTLHVLGFKTQPANVTADDGATAKLSVVATGHTPTYQWQYKIKADGMWMNALAAGNKTAELSIPATASKNGYQYRCQITDSKGNVVLSNVVTLTVKAAAPAVTITQQPANQTVKVGENAIFAVKATGTNLTYQWQWRSGTTGTWASAGATGNKTATMSVMGTTGRNGLYYRCAVTSGSSTVYSDAVLLTVTAAPAGNVTITSQPTSANVKEWETVPFTVKATGTNLTYQWQYRTKPDGTWMNALAAGNKTATLSVPATASKHGFQYRCAVSSGSTTVYSNTVNLCVLGIKTQPVDQNVPASGKLNLSVSATGIGLKYQWQYRISSTGMWMNAIATGNNTKSMSVPAAGKNGFQYRCQVTDAAGNVILSKVITVTLQ